MLSHLFSNININEEKFVPKVKDGLSLLPTAKNNRGFWTGVSNIIS
jgi:hypothetical protein